MAENEPAGGIEPLRRDSLLEQVVLARLATADPVTGQPHVVPVWYAWMDGSIWISSFESTRKVRELEKNPRCSIVVDVWQGEGNMWAFVFEGQAELIREPRQLVHEMSRKVYYRYIGTDADRPPASDWIVDQENLLIKLTPEKTYSWETTSSQAEETEA